MGFGHLGHWIQLWDWGSACDLACGCEEAALQAPLSLWCRRLICVLFVLSLQNFGKLWIGKVWISRDWGESWLSWGFRLFLHVVVVLIRELDLRGLLLLILEGRLLHLCVNLLRAATPRGPTAWCPWAINLLHCRGLQVLALLRLLLRVPCLGWSVSALLTRSVPSFAGQWKELIGDPVVGIAIPWLRGCGWWWEITPGRSTTRSECFAIGHLARCWSSLVPSRTQLTPFSAGSPVSERQSELSKSAASFGLQWSKHDQLSSGSFAGWWKWIHLQRRCYCREILSCLACGWPRSGLTFFAVAPHRKDRGEEFGCCAKVYMAQDGGKTSDSSSRHGEAHAGGGTCCEARGHELSAGHLHQSMDRFSGGYLHGKCAYPLGGDGMRLLLRRGGRRDCSSVCSFFGASCSGTLCILFSRRGRANRRTRRRRPTRRRVWICSSGSTWSQGGETGRDDGELGPCSQRDRQEGQHTASGPPTDDAYGETWSYSPTSWSIAEDWQFGWRVSSSELPFTGSRCGSGRNQCRDPYRELGPDGPSDFPELQSEKDARPLPEQAPPRPFVRGGRAGCCCLSRPSSRRCWIGRRLQSFGEDDEALDRHYGSAHGRQEEEGCKIQTGTGPRGNWRSFVERRWPLPWWSESCCSKASPTCHLSGAPDRDLPDNREVAGRGLELTDFGAGNAGQDLQCSSMGRTSEPHWQLQEQRLCCVGSRWGARCLSRRRSSSSESPLSLVVVAVRPSGNRPWQLEPCGRTQSGALAPIWGFVLSHCSECGRWRAAFQQALGCKMGRDLPESPEAARRLPCPPKQCRQVPEEGWEGRRRRQRTRCKEEGQTEAEAKEPGFSRPHRDLSEGHMHASAASPGFDEHVPGQAADPIRVAALLNSLPRWLLRIPCGLQRFLRSILLCPERNDDSTSTGGAIWPMPLPFPEVFKAGAARLPEAHLKRLVCLQVCTFDWLCLNTPDGAPASLALGKPLTSRQWRSVRILMHLSVDSNTPEFISSVDMGRAAAKVEGHQEQLAALSRAVTEVHDFDRPYSGHHLTRPGEFEGGSKMGEVIGSASVELPQPAKPLISSRLHFTEVPSFDPRPFFDEDTQKLYDFPLTGGNDPDLLPDPPRVQVRASHAERLKLYKKLAACGMLQPLDPRSFPDRYRSGLFAVPKDQERDRMVLDSRPANMVDKGQSVWCAAMASAATLSQIFLEPNMTLVCGGEDLKDYFYQFSVGPERLAKNVLAAGLTEEEAFATFGTWCQSQDGIVEVGLSTLAMGDKCACEFAQCSHLSVMLQHGVCTVAELLCLRNPIPRGLLQVGIIIDDLVVLEQVLSDRLEDPTFVPEELESSKRVLAARDAYAAVGLRNNPKKGFLASTNAKFWGVEIDGKAGLVRGASSRLWPTIAISLRVASLGLATISLLESLAGSWVSLLSVRRRMFSLLDALFAPLGSGAALKDVVRLSDEIKSELIAVSVLAPLAAVNLRAGFADFVCATDASSDCMAGVRAQVPVKVVQELSRHTLRKGAWTKLLPAEKAWRREHGMLAVEDELPDEQFRTHPLWEVMARSLDYSESWRRRPWRKAHINVLELKAHVIEEKRLATSRTSLRVPFGIDSQVTLGAVVKGRAASKALNDELKRSMCYPIGSDLYGLYMYYASASNRADGPTREREPDAPDMPLPSWWHELETGHTDEFDAWMETAGAPSPHDNLPFGQISGGSVLSPDELKPAGSLRPAARKVHRQRARKEEIGGDGLFLGKLNAEILKVLNTFKPSQFFFKDGVAAFDEPGALDLFSGTCGVAKQMVRKGCPWVLTFEWKRGSGEDLLDDNLREKLKFLVKAGAFKTLGAAPICSSFSIAITPPVRSQRFPRGIPGLRAAMRQKVKEGNSHNDFVKDLEELCWEYGLWFWIENPDSSFWWFQKRWKCYRPSDSPLCFRLCFCRFHTPWKKATKIATNTALAGLRMMCRCGERKHVQLRGTHPVKRIPWTLVAQPYPRGLNVLLATATCVSAGWCEEKRLNVAACARVNSRVGEAANPGPASKGRIRNFSLEEKPLLSAHTMALESRVLEDFVRWCGMTVTGCSANELFDAVPMFLAQALRCYGDLSFQRGGVLSNYRHLVLAAQRWKPLARPYMQSAWELVDRWEALTPVVHRVPIPEVLVQAMTVLAWNLGWYRWVGATLIAFYGAGRMGEILRCSREDLLLGEDLLESPGAAVFLRLRSFKSLHRQAARVQHMKITDETTCKILGIVYRKMPYDQPLFGAPPQQYRKRWDALIRMLGIKKDAAFTPGGLRGGSAVFHYRNNKSIQDLMWLMRLRSQVTLESYIQEVAALNAFSTLSASSRQLIQQLSAAFRFLPCASGISRG